MLSYISFAWKKLYLICCCFTVAAGGISSVPERLGDKCAGETRIYITSEGKNAFDSRNTSWIEDYRYVYMVCVHCRNCRNSFISL